MKLTDQEIQRIKKNLPLSELVLLELFLSEYHSKSSKVEEMQKTLEWYADEKNWKLGVHISMGSAFPLHEAIKSDLGNRARRALKGVETE
jgi:hypothetical protein